MYATFCLRSFSLGSFSQKYPILPLGNRILIPWQLFIYRSFIYVFHLSCTYLQESRVGYLDYLADQKLLASTCWHDSYTQLLQLSATEYCLVIFPSHASNSKILYSVKASANFRGSKVFRLLDTLTRLVFG